MMERVRPRVLGMPSEPAVRKLLHIIFWLTAEGLGAPRGWSRMAVGNKLSRQRTAAHRFAEMPAGMSAILQTLSQPCACASHSRNASKRFIWHLSGCLCAFRLRGGSQCADPERKDTFCALATRKCTTGGGETVVSTHGDGKKQILKGKIRMGSCQHRGGCNRQSVFGDKDEGKAKWCRLHRNSSHVDLRNPRCMFEGCDHRRVYGPPPAAAASSPVGVGRPLDSNKSKPLYCFRHKGPEDIDLIHKRCMHIEGCRKNPCFGSPGDGLARFCQVALLLHLGEVLTKLMSGWRAIHAFCASPGGLRTPSVGAQRERPY